MKKSADSAGDTPLPDRQQNTPDCFSRPQLANRLQKQQENRETGDDTLPRKKAFMDSFQIKKQLFLHSGLAILKFCITFIPIVFQQELTSQEKSFSWETSEKNAAQKLRSTNAKKCARQCGTRTSNTCPFSIWILRKRFFRFKTRICGIPSRETV